MGLVALAAGCGGDDSGGTTPTATDAGAMVTCGTGTKLKDNECVADATGTTTPETKPDSGMPNTMTPTMALKCGTGTIEADGMCIPDPDKAVACGDGTMAKDGKCVPTPPSPDITDVQVSHLEFSTQGAVLDGNANADTVSQYYPVEVSIGLTYKGDKAKIPVVLSLMKPPSKDEALPPRDDQTNNNAKDTLGCVIGGLEIEHPGGANPTEAISTVKLQVPKGCLGDAEDSRQVAPVVLIDPDRQLHAKNQDAVSRAVAFYKANTHDSDIAACRRDANSTGAKGTCAVEFNIRKSPGLDFELEKLTVESSVVVVDKCGDTAPHTLTVDAWKSLLDDATSYDNDRPATYRCNSAIVPDFKIKMKAGPNGQVPDLDQYGNKQYDLDSQGHPQIATVTIDSVDYPSYLYGEADIALDATVITHGETHSDITSFDQASGMMNNSSPVAHNALKDHALQIRYQLRPTSSNSDDDWRPLYLHNKGEQAKADEMSTSGQDKEQFEENTAVPATPSYYTHGLYVENDCGEKNKATCNNALNPRDEIVYGKWANETNFTVKACLVPVTDAGADDTAIDKFPGNNCKTIEVRVVRRPTSGNTKNASSYSFSKDWGDGAGNASTLRLSWGFYTHNNLDTAGATTDNQANITVESSLIGATDIFKAWGRAAAYVSLVGSYYDYGVSSFGQKLWGESKQVPEYHWDKDFAVSKEYSRSFRLWAGPIPVSVSLRLYGEAGLLISLDVIAEDPTMANDDDDRALSMKFPGALRIGLAMAGATPHGLIKATASAGIDLLVFRAGVAGELTLVSLQTPLTGYLGWGMTQLSPVILRAGVWADLKLNLTIMAGRVYLYAEHWEVWGCGWSLCSGYNRFWDYTIASWNGWNWNQTLWSSPFYNYDVKL